MGKFKESFNNWKNSTITWNRLHKKAQDLLGLTKKKSARNKNNESRPIFPPEVIIEILSWLPIKYLSQVQLVCKEWQAVIHDHYFVEKHMSRSSVLCHWHNAVNDGTSLHSQPEHDDTFSYIHGCDGLLLFRNNISLKYVIWNPAIRRVLELPDPHNGNYGLVLCYVPTTGSYRIVSIYKDNESGGAGCEVLTLSHSKSPRRSWRHLTFPDVMNADELTKREKVSVVLGGGAVHCVRVTKFGNETVSQIVTLDVETECFTVNHLPNGPFHDMKTVWELDWDGKLAFAEIVGHNLQLMELEDYRKHRWCGTKKIIPLPFLKDNGIEGNVFPLFNKKGELWFWLQNEKIFVYTIKTGKITHVMSSKRFLPESKLCPYKPSLVTFEGMQPDTNLEKYRPRIYG